MSRGKRDEQLATQKLKDIVPHFTDLMGVKAVYGRSPGPESVICFGGRGTKPNDSAYFSQGRSVAERAIEKPYFITIGGGAEVQEPFDGHVIELVRATGVYGRTDVFVKTPATLKRLQQWPVSVVLTEVYRIEGEPRLIEDLKFTDKKILTYAYDGVVFYDEHVEALWEALKDFAVIRRWDIQPPPGFRDPHKLYFRLKLYPQVSVEEGKKILKECLVLERNSAAAKAAKDRNRDANRGKYICEGCDLSDEERGLFDAHHLQPLAIGPRISTIDSYAVLCALCHRWAHFKADDKLSPLPIAGLRKLRLGPS